jgi:hypothetical protein
VYEQDFVRGGLGKEGVQADFIVALRLAGRMLDPDQFDEFGDGLVAELAVDAPPGAGLPGGFAGQRRAGADVVGARPLPRPGACVSAPG